MLIGTYVGIGALAHDYGFSLAWVMLSTVLIWAGPAQVILVSALGPGAAPVEVALAVGLCGVRLLPMVVALLPLMRGAADAQPRLCCCRRISPRSACGWSCSALLPTLPREQRRRGFCNGLGIGFMLSAPHRQRHRLLSRRLAAAAADRRRSCSSRRCRFWSRPRATAATLADGLALALGLVVSPLLVYAQIGLDLMWTGIIAGSAAYAVHRLREALR